MRGLSFGTIAASAPAGGGPSPTVYTLTFGNVEATTAWDSFAISPYFNMNLATSGGSGTTGLIEFGNGTDEVFDAEAIAADLQAELETIVGAGLATVAGSGTGESRVLEVTFDASLTVTNFEFGATFIWEGTCAINFSVTQEGTDPASGTAAVMGFTVITASDGDHTATNGTDSVTVTVGAGSISSITATPTGWTLSAGGVGQDTVTFTFDSVGSAGAPWSLSSGDATFGFTDGTPDETGEAEVQQIYCNPKPIEGNWTISGNPIAYNEGDAVVQAAVDSVMGGSGIVVVGVVGGTSLADGIFTFTWQSPGMVSDSILGILVGTLATPEITRSIS